MNNEAPVLYKIAKTVVNKDHNFDNGTIHQAARVIADTLGTVYSGVRTDAFQRALKNRVELFGTGDFEILGIENRSSLAGAVFYNTLAISSTDYDEGHRKAVGHPASMIVPAALILGKHLKASKVEILKSVIIGYEIATRFSNARIRKKITTYSSGRWGAIGTAATASYLLGLSIEQTLHALSNAAILSPAMLGGSTDVSTGSMSKEGAAWAAQAGLQSTLISKDGFVGPYLFVDDHDDYNNDILVQNLGKSWLINSNYFKPFACCRWLHSAIAAVIDIDADIEEIEHVEVRIFGRAIDLIGNKYPENPVQAQFHLPYCVAIGLLYSEVTPKYFTNDIIMDERVRATIDKIIVMPDDWYTKLFPAQLPSKVIIYNTENLTLSKEVVSAPWDADNPPTDDQLFKKFISQSGNNDKKLWNNIMK